MTKSIQFTIWCKDEGSPDTSAWPEEYTQVCSSAEKWASVTIKKFNATRRPGDKKRILLRVEVKPNETLLSHAWTKSCLATIIKDGFLYDTYRCSRCGGTGKRNGINAGVSPDRGTKSWCA